MRYSLAFEGAAFVYDREKMKNVPTEGANVTVTRDDGAVLVTGCGCDGSPLSPNLDALVEMVALANEAAAIREVRARPDSKMLVPVSEALPAYGVPLVLYAQGVTFGYRAVEADTKAGPVFVLENGRRLLGVTAWMPVPEDPSTDEDEGEPERDEANECDTYGSLE